MSVFNWNYHAAVELKDSSAQVVLAQSVLDYLPELKALGTINETGKNEPTGIQIRAWRDAFEMQVCKIVEKTRELLKTTHGPLYRVEPWTSISDVQPIRLASSLLADGVGNCLDWALLLAAPLLFARHYPLILVVASDIGPHAYLGVWRQDSNAPANELAVLDGAAIRGAR